MNQFERRVAAIERAMKVTMEGHVIVIRGGIPNTDPTEVEIAEAVSRSRAERGRLMVLGGLPE
jgi:predicted Rossmann-fold nucleotide-binding protein